MKKDEVVLRDVLHFLESIHGLIVSDKYIVHDTFPEITWRLDTSGLTSKLRQLITNDLKGDKRLIYKEFPKR